MSEVWFDTQEGVLLEDEDAARHRAGAADPTAVPLAHLLTAPDFPFRNGDFPVKEHAEWTRESCIEFGRWALGVLRDAQPDANSVPKLTRDHLERLRVLGIGPGRYTMNTYFGNLAAFGMAAEIKMGKNGAIADGWAIGDYVQFADGLAARLGRKPVEADYTAEYDAGRGPSLWQILREAGGIAELNDRIGYPNIQEWDLDDYVDWGVRVMRANPGKALTGRLIGLLSKAKRGPSPSIIITKEKFGSLAAFQDKVWAAAREAQEHEQAHHNRLLAEYATIARKGYPIDDEPDEQLRYVAKWMLVDYFLPKLGLEEQAALAMQSVPNMVRSLRKLKPSVTKADVEIAALTLDIFDEVWPITSAVLMKHLHVPDGQLDPTRSDDARRFTSGQVLEQTRAA